MQDFFEQIIYSIFPDGPKICRTHRRRFASTSRHSRIQGVSCFHAARETGVHFFGAGHHATERLGVRALGEHLSEVFGIEHRFVDVANPF
jgi:hypothetical protein